MFIVSAVRAHPNIAASITVGGIVCAIAVHKDKGESEIVGCSFFSGIFAGLAVLSFRSISSPHDFKDFKHTVKNLGRCTGGVVSLIGVCFAALVALNTDG